IEPPTGGSFAAGRARIEEGRSELLCRRVEIARRFNDHQDEISAEQDGALIGDGGWSLEHMVDRPSLADLARGEVLQPGQTLSLLRLPEVQLRAFSPFPLDEAH